MGSISIKIAGVGLGRRRRRLVAYEIHFLKKTKLIIH